MDYNQSVVLFSMGMSLVIFISIKFDQTFRIMRRSYIDEIEHKARVADTRIADLQRQLEMQYHNELINEVVAPRVTQLMFDLPAQNSRLFKFPYTVTDKDTGEVYNLCLTGKWTDWNAWQAGKQYVKRRNKEYWIDPADLSLNDLIPVLRRIWDKRIHGYREKSIWIYSDEKLNSDIDIGPFTVEE